MDPKIGPQRSEILSVTTFFEALKNGPQWPEILRQSTFWDCSGSGFQTPLDSGRDKKMDPSGSI